jgi:L-histidine N-alpha-methyltransferase
VSGEVDENGESALLAEVLGSLRETPPRLPSKLFYDAAGSQLFEQISRLPEYGLTRAEESILAQHSEAIARTVALNVRNVAVLEPGCGSSDKAAALLQHLDAPLYVGIDISRPALELGAERIRARAPQAVVQSVVADISRSFDVPPLEGRRRVVFFPGSTIGNDRLPAAIKFLSRLGDLAGPGGAIIVGTDLWRAPRLLRLAYDDPAGVTARFNRNALKHLQWRFKADVNPEGFAHVIVIDEAAQRVEMHLEAKGRQTLSLGESHFTFAAGQRIHTEDSHKFTVPGFLALAEKANLKPLRHWQDETGTFAVHALSR